MSAKNTYMKFDYMRLSQLPILRRLGGFGTNNSHKNFAKCENCGSRTCFRVLEDLVPICVNSTHLEKIIPVLHRRNINSYRQKQKKIRKGNDQEMGQSERNSHSINRGVGKTKMTLRYLYHENMS